MFLVSGVVTLQATFYMYQFRPEEGLDVSNGLQSVLHISLFSVRERFRVVSNEFEYAYLCLRCHFRKQKHHYNNMRGRHGSKKILD